MNGAPESSGRRMPPHGLALLDGPMMATLTRCAVPSLHGVTIWRKVVEPMARDEAWDALKNHAKQVHSERVAKNPDRIAYAIQQFEAHGIEYQLKNEQTGHFHCWRKSDDKLFQFYAGTGKIQGFAQVRGIHSLIQMLER